MQTIVTIVAMAMIAGGSSEAGPKRPRRRPVRTHQRHKPKPKPAPAPTPAPTPAPPPVPATKDTPPAAVYGTGTWKTTIAVTLRDKAGEHADKVAELPVGTEVTVVGENGRWLRVRAAGHVGYLTRTTIASDAPAPAIDPAAAPPAPTETDPTPRKRWGADRRAASSEGSGLFVGVTAQRVSVLSEPRTGAASVFEATRGTRLAAIETRDGGWIHVRDDAGHDGWITRAAVDNSTANVALDDKPAVALTAEPATPDRAPVRVERRFAITAGAALGYRSVGMDFTSNGSVGLSNYLVSADAAAVDVDVDVATRVTSRLHAGGDVRIQGGTSSGSGISYAGPSRAGGDIPFKTLAVDAGARVGTQRGVFGIAARAGVHYDAFLADEVANAARLPRESLFGVTGGARVRIAPPRSRVTVGLRFDMLVLGTRSQTSGLEDGTSSDAGALWAGATIRIALGRHLSLLSAYDFGRATTTWSGMSVRFADVTAAKRVDSTQTVQIGVAAEL